MPLVKFLLVLLPIEGDQTHKTLVAGQDHIVFVHQLQPAEVPREAQLGRALRHEFIFTVGVVVPDQRLQVVDRQTPVSGEERLPFVVLVRDPSDA